MERDQLVLKAWNRYSPVLKRGVVLSSVVLISGCGLKQAEAERPNIIIVLADDQGWGDMAYNGHTVLQTPNFDELAATGLRFDRYYAAAPVCSPTRGSLMTGRHPNRFGCFSWGNTLRPQEFTLAEALQQAGYVTGHFGKWHLGSVRQGSPVNPGNSGFHEWLSAPNFFENDPILSREGVATQMAGESSMVTVEAALGFIQKHKSGDKPFFAYVCFGSPHQPHIAAEEDKALYPGLSEKLQNFYGEITGMDRAIGKLRAELKEMGIEKNTLLWYLSDNGGLPGVGTTGGRGNKSQIYEGGLRVPSIIEWPARIPEHRSTHIPCSTVDVMPTLLEIAGADQVLPHPVDGISLVRLIDGKMDARQKPLGFWQYPSPGVPTPSVVLMSELLKEQQGGSASPDSALFDYDAGIIKEKYPLDVLPGHAAWLQWPFKLHRIHPRNGVLKYELYNLQSDPKESTDLSVSDSSRVKSMAGELEDWMRSVTASLNGEDYR